MKRKFRTRLLVDGQLQGALLCRVALYWCVSVAVMVMLAGLQAAWASQNASWPVVINRAMLAFGPALIAAMVVLPFLLFDALRFSLSFAGPMRRLRNEAKRLADGEAVAPINFRKGDYWYDLATEFNRLSEELHKRRNAEAEAEPDATTTVVLPGGADPISVD